jgi:hypothetical protein
MTMRSNRLQDARPIAGVVLLLVIVSSGGCGSGGGSGITGPSIVADFVESGTASAADRVRLVDGSVSDDRVTIQVTIAGPTTSGDLYAFAFDLLISDPTVAAYVPGTATFGSALVLGAGQQQAVLVSQSGDRVVVGVSKIGGGAGSGNGIGASEESILSLTLRVLREGATDVTIVGSPGNPQNPTPDPAALGSTGTLIGSVTFDPASATISGVSP